MFVPLKVRCVDLIALVLFFLCSSCTCVNYSSNLWLGSSPPILDTGSSIDQYLNLRINKPVSQIDEMLGGITVGWKRIGVFGWRDMNYFAQVTGETMQVAVSSDKFMTIDVAIETIEVDKIPVILSG